MPQPDLSQLINAVVDDTDVKAAVKALAMSALNEAQEIIDSGAPQQKSNVLRMLLPALVASLKETQSGDGLEELRKTQNELFAATRDAT